MRTARRILRGNQAAVRHAGDHGPLYPRPIQRQIDLLEIVLESLLRLAGEGTRALVAERERDDAMVPRQRVDGRTHPFPPALQAWNDDDWNARSGNEHRLVPQRLSSFESVLNPFERLALAQQAHER